MKKCTVVVARLNKRSSVPASFADKSNVTGVVLKSFSFFANEAVAVNPNVGKWYVDRDNNFYWGGGLDVLDEVELANPEDSIDNEVLESFSILPATKLKIEKVINAFESGSAQGNYAALVKYKDHTHPVTKERQVQVTYGRSQTTEYGHLKALIKDYVERNGMYADALSPYVNRIGQYPSLAPDDFFCTTLKKAGKEDPVMRACQDDLFQNKYYMPAFNWFTANGFKQALSMLVIYDSFIHSGGILSFLRKRFSQVVPASGGNEAEWVQAYVNTRHNWLANHSEELLRKTIYRTNCFRKEVEAQNWHLSSPINANGVLIN